MDQATAGSTENLPLLGYRNYWYPIVEARRVKRKALSVRILGEDLVLFPGKDGKVAALTDRCPHRGVKLCRGRILFPGTISCGYHGWTFDERGECVAAIVEGPESRLPGKVKVKAYPTEIRHGIVWAFLGDGKPPPIEEDLPQEISTPGRSFQFLFEEWSCDWRNVTENYPDMLHALFVHRNSFEMIFQKIPAWGRMIVKPLPDGKGISVQGPGAALQADYSGLGRYPRKAWWRVLSRRTSAGVGAEVRMPGYIVLPLRREPYFGFFFSGWQWPIPIDEHRTRILEATITYPRNVLSRFGYRLWWNLYYKWVHRWAFTYQDERQIGVQNYRKFETVCSTDVGITLWRRLARQIARPARDQARPWNGHDRTEERESV